MNCILPLALVVVVSLGAEGAERARDYGAALALAEKTGKDIAVYQRGSDWNRLGERLYADVWLKPELAAAAGDNVILVAVDSPEAAGGTAAAMLWQMTGRNQPVPPCDIISVTSADGAKFKARPDGDYVAEGPNPAQDTLTLKLMPKRDGNAIRIDFRTDATLPGNGPGRAPNGNFAIQEIEISSAGSGRVKPQAAWASEHKGGWGAWHLIDGISDKHDNQWNAEGQAHQPRTLLIALPQRISSGIEVSLRLICRTNWGQHVPGCIRTAVVAEPHLESAIQTAAVAEELNMRNARFNWRGDNVPRIALMDSQGRAVTSEDKPRLGLTPTTLGARIRELQQVRIRRDALWAAADKAQGPAKAELLRQSLDLLDLGNSAGHENAYKFVHEGIRAADPNDESGAQRWLQFSRDPRGMPKLVNDALKLVGEKKYEEALAMLDRELADPRNRVLDHDRIQRVILGRFQVYRQWPGKEEKRFDELKKIAALDLTTYHGIGATGYLNMHHRTAVPEFVCYGWAPSQVKKGVTLWDLKVSEHDAIDHAGPYNLQIRHSGGRDTVRIRSAALMDGGNVIFRHTPDADLKPKGKIEIPLTVRTWNPVQKPILRIEVEAKEGKTDCAGRIEFEPLLEESVGSGRPEVGASQ